jgi:hypothetical protein
VSKVVVGPTGVMQAFIDLLGNSAFLMSGSTLVPGLRPSLPLTSLYDLFGQIKTSVQTVVPAVNNSLNTIGSGVFVRFELFVVALCAFWRFAKRLHLYQCRAVLCLKSAHSRLARKSIIIASVSTKKTVLLSCLRRTASLACSPASRPPRTRSTLSPRRPPTIRTCAPRACQYRPRSTKSARPPLHRYSFCLLCRHVNRFFLDSISTH